METLEQAIESAKKVIANNNLQFATIWKTGKSFGFNFDKKDVGYSFKECGIKRTVVQIIN